MWNYLFFMSYLLEKDDTDYTTNEVRVVVRVCVFFCACWLTDSFALDADGCRRTCAA